MTPPTSATLTHTGETPRLLLVEDDEIFADLTRVILAERGFADERTIVVGSIADATATLRSNDIGLILADLTLPDAYGLEVVRRCRDLVPDVPIIVLTANRDLELALEALAQGAQDYLIKGDFDDEDLMRAIRYALARTRAEVELRATLHALEVSNGELEESNGQLEQYASIASHDLRSPVRTARLLVGRLIASPCIQADPTAVALGDVLDASLGRLETMLEGLLDYAQARDLSSSGEFRDELLSSLITELSTDIDADLRSCGALLEVSGDASLRAHPVLVRSLMLNAVANAVKYRSERPLRITVSGQGAEDGMVLVRVADNGIGIEPRFRTRVFAMFERLSNGGEGIGLGLSMCHRIVSLHGGRIWIEDGLDGSGISLCFTIPGHVTKRSRTMTAEVRRALDERWPRARESALTQLGVIESFTVSSEAGDPGDRVPAGSAAHKLSGCLGMFGRRDASAVASAIEELLAIETTATTAHELRVLVDRLSGMVATMPVPAAP